ncbi:hypothetical protein ACWT_0386 [Actinoplanes sp. SE50]|uniref:hypothetical protein n=1 Tax=unclassified Actinoplanes TaxID=2626549 RepID=UPI00023EC554|nr:MULTISPECIES: hypothetical protein [unclassified Actinoplanes]AEV81398.1 hypothetical protein ACPL_501 [Actinoplanes sp. SE50/110]ATO79801.1 hypothetical protein ACWT_0386 [Actinoplanes sp. SE50]SLL97203.1 hypothetical protein ACSP50_0400 [Actinoplanes sp. SE50/110]
MTPARSLAASVAALGFASTLTAPLPAHAASTLAPAPAPCQQAHRYAAQSEAELLRIERLDLRPTPNRDHGAGLPRHDSGERPSIAPTESAGEVLQQLTPDDPAATAGSGSPDSPAAGEDADSADTSDATAMPAPGVVPAAYHPGHRARSGLDAAGNRDVRWKRDAAGNRDVRWQRDAAYNREVRWRLDALDSSHADRDARIELGKPGATGGGDANGDTRPATAGAGDTTQVIGGVGVGDARSVMIADGPVKSAAAAQTLDGRVAGAPAAEQVLQQTPPTHSGPVEQHTAAERLGPIQTGTTTLSAHARWTDAMACAATAGETSRAATALDRVTLTGATGELIRVPAKSSTISNTALTGHGTTAKAVASATVRAAEFTLAGGEIHVRVLRAPSLQVSMSAATGGEVRYQPAAVEISGPHFPRTRLSTATDHADITVSDAARPTESATVPVLPSRGPALPSIPNLPVPSPTTGPGSSTGTSARSSDKTSTRAGNGPDAGGTVARGPVLESAPAGQALVRISLGDVRQASKGHALAARATAIKIAVLRSQHSSKDRGNPGYESSAVIANLGVGILEAAAVAPEQGKRTLESGVQGGTLPVTGPRSAPLFITGAGLLIGGLCAFLLGTRRRRPTP